MLIDNEAPANFEDLYTQFFKDAHRDIVECVFIVASADMCT